MNKETDEVLMRKVAEGNIDVLRLLFNKHHLHIYNFLFKMSGDKMLSEDLTQEVFYNVIKYRKSYNNGKFLPWLFTIARNSLKKHFINKKEVPQDLDLVRFKVNEDNNSEDYSHLHYALQHLDPEERELIVLNRIEGIKYKELAEIMGSTPGAIKTRMSRILKKLKSIYNQTI